MSLPDGYGYPTSIGGQGQRLGGALHGHEPPRGHRQRLHQVHGTGWRQRAPLKKVKPYWMDINDCHVDPFYNIPGTGKPGSVNVASRDLTMPSRGGSWPASATSTAAPGSCDRPAGLRQPRAGESGRPGATPTIPSTTSADPARTRADPHDGVPIPAGNPGQRRREDPLELDLRQLQASHRVMGISQIYVGPDPTVTQNCSPMPNDMARARARARPGAASRLSSPCP